MQTRIYAVLDGDETRLIEASCAAAAVRFCARERYTARVAKAKDIAGLMKHGVKLELARPEQAESEAA